MHKVPKSGIFRKNSHLMKKERLHNVVSEWVEALLSKGRTAFSLKEARGAFNAQSEVAMKRSLNRLSRKEKIVSIHKGYYIIVPPQYASRGILPPTSYLDELMKFLQRSYYVGLLNAAAFYGAAHQQPQEFFIVTTYPALRTTKRKGLKVNYVSKNEIPEKLLESRKTESGYIKVSSPELTAADLIQFEKRIGGLDRAATVLNELAEEMKPEKFDKEFFKHVSIATIQRLGYLLDGVLNKEELAASLYEKIQQMKLELYRLPLKASGKIKGFSSDEKWKVIINTDIEIDE